MKFFNREKEIKEVLSVIESEPQLIHFIYGPINSGKTALINEIIKNRLDKSRYEVIYINLRGRFIEDYKSFIKVLFNVKKESFREKIKNFFKGLFFSLPRVLNKEAIKRVSSGILEGIPIAESLLEKFLKKNKIEDVFVFLENYFENVRKKEKIPILIIDEFQVIGDLKINGFLIYKLFNFFIHLTKERHLAHVFCLSSDSLFIEKVYNEGKLEGRAKYILVDDFEKKEAIEFLSFLEKEILRKENFLSQSEKEKVYDLVGGKPVYLVSIINDLKTKPLDKVLSYLLQDEKQKIKYFLEDIEERDIELYKKVINVFKFFQDKEEIPDSLVKKSLKEFLVNKNILFLDPVKGILKPQSRLTWHAINKTLKELNLV